MQFFLQIQTRLAWELIDTYKILHTLRTIYIFNGASNNIL